MQKYLTPSQVAEAIGVSEATLKRWCDRGLIHYRRTAGGHRRIPLSAVMAFVRENDHELVRPDVLGLPPRSSSRITDLAEAVDPVFEVLRAGDRPRFSTLSFDLILAGHRIAEICDRTFAPAINRLGDCWEEHQLSVYQERRACEMCSEWLHQAKLFLAAPPVDAPVAIGGTLSGDPYTLATQMVALSLRDVGWATENLGWNLPADSICDAIREHRPQLAWVAARVIETPAKLSACTAKIFETCAAVGAALVLGGPALNQVDPRSLHFTVQCRSLTDLVAFAAAWSPAKKETGSADPAAAS